MKLHKEILGTVTLSFNPTVTVVPAALIGLIVGLFLSPRTAADWVWILGTLLFFCVLIGLVPTVLAALFSAGARRARLRMEAKVPPALLSFLNRATVTAAALGAILALILQFAAEPGRHGIGPGRMHPALGWIFTFDVWVMLFVLALCLFVYLAGSSSSRIRADGAPLRQMGLSLCRVLQDVYARVLVWLLPLAAFAAGCLLTGFLTGGRPAPVPFPWPAPWRFLEAFGTVLLPLVLVPSLVVPAGCWYLLRRCGKDCPRHFLGFFKQVLVQAAAVCSRGRVAPVLVHNLARLGVPESAALLRTRAALLTGPVATAFYVAFAAVTLLPLPPRGPVSAILKLLLSFAVALLLSRADLPVPSAGLALALLLPGVILSGRAEIPALLLLFLFERGLDIIRTVTNVLFAGTAVYLSDKLHW
jgi:Na+/H+-dicarboxylate symporter